jgi:hypothetical protein
VPTKRLAFVSIFNATDAYNVDDIFVDVKKQQAISFIFTLKATDARHSRWLVPNKSAKEAAFEYL